MRQKLFPVLFIALASSCTGTPSEGIHTLCVLSTNDIHGAYFDSTYTGSHTNTSLLSVKHVTDSIRTLYGKDNVLLVDVGDNLQGDNAAYFFNYVDTMAPHIFPRMASAIGYDAVILGNHDIETGHPVYDRIASQFEELRIPYLAGNAIRENGSRYFQGSVLIKKAGLDVLLLGYDNAAISTWLDQSLWSGMHFEDLIPLVQQDVDSLSAWFNPDVVVVAAHTGAGKGDGSVLESQGLDLLHSLQGVDVVLCAHDHRPFCDSVASAVLVNAGSKCKFVGKAEVQVQIDGGKVLSKSSSASLIPVSPALADAAMREHFREDFLKVRKFTLREVGELSMELRTRDAYKGMSDYINLIHSVCLEASGADLSFAAPLTYDGTIAAGKLAFDDMFTIYPFENQLYTMKMTGTEIKNYLEYSYGGWINTSGSEHLLKIKYDNRYDGALMSWSFEGRTYNFDSAGGLNYSVDVRRPQGERVQITSFADGSVFDTDAEYLVALTSYRAAGGGNLIREGAGIADPDKRIVKKYSMIRELILNYISENKVLTPELVGRCGTIGEWSFVPENYAGPRIAADLELVFGSK